ncbi:hypothetical protein LOZ12_004069 [Ophidiomyces ophidiicola]|uniref:Uncharacterized protein n=1 Tax=Ophidiomyces ophidiicola TaxID=1387563 RepID=A0ACB8V1S8_9EURO|nr:uncharacterized protein LOZ57_004309 [Ophidiomyces ophidiicola]KAI1914852.1 hypothetical protein LOZ61_001989 [Ophidiomyces ophidiicola]KAI1925129.1 hypothetical protein LOZ60_004265 [Ophidiomyces ophidiicola]KAI1945278.1 hypothetical protein LOZ57_004309 [Ophidiomyces ophidiicola]KAI1953477.1 hypothetical protein LOZ62_001034 [Ophidiomyces ophidiicola]KAI1957465.1 hypothetical protein LOZ59_003918 [Ophidiomyces ophidiicola]
MSARVFLDKPHAHFTNLDFITGRVVLSLPVETAVTLVVVKLEGESRTRLVAPKHPHNERSDKKRTEIESHKLLYKTVTLFPTPEMRPLVAPSTYYTLSPGTYEYPFHFKFPFNNDCINNVLASNLNMAGIRLEVARDTNRHLKKTLPPSLFGFPGEAEIRYFVKVTVVRPQFYKENYRGFADFKFLPIEPPRTKEADKETFARRQHQFSRFPNIQEEKGFFRKTSVKSQDTSTPPKFSVDARLPSPAIITCNEPLPLRVLVKKLEEFSETLYLQLFQIELIGYTHLRAHDLSRKQSSSWVITSRSNLNVPLGSADNPVGKEWKIDSRMWNQIPLPNSVAPSFDTCNISRSYELEVRVGISRGLNGSIKSDLVVLPLRIAVQVYSGVAPPPALLEAMGMPSELPGVSTHSRPPQPPRPSAPPYTSPPPAENYEDAPPSYEDAMAESLGPVDGPRREYNPLDASVSGNVAQTGADAQGSSVRNFKDGDRLFPSSSAVNTSTDSVNACDQPTLTDGPADPRFPRTESANTVHRSDTNAPKPVISGNQAPSPQPETNTLWPERRVTPGLGIPSRKPVPGSKHSTPSMERFSG